MADTDVLKQQKNIRIKVYTTSNAMEKVHTSEMEFIKMKN